MSGGTWRWVHCVPAWATLALLAGLTVALRLPFLTPRLAHWDAVNYALGLHDFNVAAHQPHPPGSPLYILLGRAALSVVGDDNAALILVSVVASVGAVLLEYVLARLLFGHRAGLVAAVLLLSQPIFWGYGTLATPWTLLSCLALAIGVCALLLCRGRRWLVFPSAALVGLASGFRLDATVFLAPLWLWSLWHAEPRWRRRVGALALVAVLILAWLVPVAGSGDGFVVWFERLLAILPPTATDTSLTVRQLVSNTAVSWATLALVIGPPAIVSIACNRTAAWCFLRTQPRTFWLLWIGPAFAFLWLVDATEAGHNLVFSVALCALGAGFLVASAEHRGARLVVCAALLVGMQTAVFLGAGPRLDKPPAWAPNAMVLNVTAPGLRQHQASLAAALQVIRDRFEPTDTAVLTVVGQDPYRFMMYYLPEYRVLRLDPTAHSALEARARRQGNWTALDDCLFPSRSGVRHVVWVLLATSEAGLIPDGAAPLLATSDGPFQVWSGQSGQAVSEYLGFSVAEHCGS